MATIYCNTSDDFSNDPFLKVTASALDINCANGQVTALNTARTIAFTPSVAGDCSEVVLPLAIKSNTAGQSVLVELQENSGGWVTRASKTMNYDDIIGTHKAEMVTAGMAIVAFTFDTGSYPVALTTDADTWRLQITSTDSNAYICNSRSGGYAYVIPIDTATTYSSGDSVIVKNDVELALDMTVTLTDIWYGTNCTIGNSNPAASYTWTVTGYQYRGNNSVFQAGSESTPVSFANQLTLAFTNLLATTFHWNGDTQWEDYVYGAYTTTYYSTIASDAASGQKNIVLADDLSAVWQAGDTIWIWGADSVETKVIDSMSGTTCTVTVNLSQTHADGWYVVNLTRVQNAFGIASTGKLGNVSSALGTTGSAAHSLKFEYSGIYQTGSTGPMLNTYNSGTGVGTGTKNILIQHVFINSGAGVRISLTSDYRSSYANVQIYEYIFKNNSSGSSFVHVGDDAIIRNMAFGTYINPVAIGGTGVGNNLDIDNLQATTVWSGAGYGGMVFSTMVGSTMDNCKIGKVGTGLKLSSAFNNTFTGCTIDAQSTGGVYYNNTCTSNRFINCDFGSESANTSDIAYASGILVQDVYDNCLWGSTTITGDTLSSAAEGSFIKIRNFDQTTNDNRAYFTYYKIVYTGYGLSDTTVWNGTAFAAASAGQFGLKLTPQSGTNLANYYFWDALDSRSKGKLTGDQTNKVITGLLRIKINNANFYAGTHTLPCLRIYYDNATTATQATATSETTDAQLLVTSFAPTGSTPNVHPYIRAATDASGTDRDIYIGFCDCVLPNDTSINNTQFTYASDGCSLPPDATLPTPAGIWAVATSTLTGAGTIGKQLTDNVDQAISTTESNIRGSDSDDLKDISDEIAAMPAAPSAEDVADQVWDEATSGHKTAGTFGKLIQFIKNLVA